MGLQSTLTVVAVLILASITLFMYVKRKKSRPDLLLEEKLTLERLLEKVKYELADIVKEETFFGRDDSEWEALYNRKLRIQKAMQNCVFGIDSDKIIVKELIKSIVQEILPTEEKLIDVIDLNNQFVDPMVKFEILMYYLKKQYGKGALKHLIKKYHLDKVRYDIEDGTVPSFAITVEDIDFIYQEEVKEELPYLVQLDVTATLLYQKYKGFGCVDTLREMDIDGFNCGTSGSILSSVLELDRDVVKAPRSVWIYFEGKYIHARFLTFYTEEELRRVVQLICRYNNPGPLTEKRGYLVNTMFDKSRVLALRPPASEFWAVFVRKFTLSSQTLDSLVNPVLKDSSGVPVVNEQGETVYKYQNAQLPKRTIEFLMRGQVTTAFTGRQGSGKTTLMTAAIAPVDARFTIRVLEMAPEMYLRELFPERNILSVQETQTVSAAELQDALKKSDAALSIVGEVATDIIAARMIQMGQVASIFTIFSHHANRTRDLVDAITNSIVASSKGSATPETVMPQVIDVIKCDVHLDYDVDGNRYIERITEIIRLDKQPYPDYNPYDPLNSMNHITREYYTRSTDRKMFKTRDIVIFDKKTFTYYVDEFFSDELLQHITARLPGKYLEDFNDFVLQNWGGEEADG